MNADPHWMPHRPGWYRVLIALLLSYVLVVLATAVLIAFSVTVGTRLTSAEGLVFFLLVLVGLARLELRIERTGNSGLDDVPSTRVTTALGVFAAGLVLPLLLLVALVVVYYLYGWLRVNRTADTVPRMVLSIAAVIVASACSTAILRAGGMISIPLIPTSGWSLLVGIGAAACWWLVHYLVVAGAMVLVLVSGWASD